MSSELSTQNTQKKLCTLFEADYIEMIDNSAQHAGHQAMKGIQAEAATHLAILLVSKQFEGKPLVTRHRMVQKALAEEFAADLHALQIKALTPTEWAQRKPSQECSI